MTVLTRANQAECRQRVIDCYQTQSIHLEKVAVAKRHAEFINPDLDILNFHNSPGCTRYLDANRYLSPTL